MMLGRKIAQAICDHDNALLRITGDYNSATVTCTAVWREIRCPECGKIIVPRYLYDEIRRAMIGEAV